MFGVHNLLEVVYGPTKFDLHPHNHNRDMAPDEECDGRKEGRADNAKTISGGG